MTAVQLEMYVTPLTDASGPQFFISCNFSKLVAFFTSHVLSKPIASTFWCFVDSAVASVYKKLGKLQSLVNHLQMSFANY